ncbi:MAG TPA: hypothetical protein VH595_24150 [Verrucomicrobiae bacterium]|jgi:flagellar basal body L-ring protein FlgH|nr:hypothetical protein [Verrucomicrobiae bacterium]
MSRFLKNGSMLLGVCSVILLAGCAAPMAPEIAKNQPSASQADATIRVSASESPTSSDSKPPGQPAAQKQSESLTGQLADSIVNILGTFTGH